MARRRRGGGPLGVDWGWWFALAVILAWLTYVVAIYKSWCDPWIEQ